MNQVTTTKMMKKISIALDETEQNMLLIALMEKAISCQGEPAEESYKQLYGEFYEAIATGTIIDEQ
jgi:hypothetical protein